MSAGAASRGRALLVALSLGLLLAASAVLSAREARFTLPVPLDRTIDLQAGRAVRAMSLSFDALAADLYWIRAVQHYGGDRLSTRTTGRYELLWPLLDLTTTLDPHFAIAYRFGAFFLSLPEPDGPDRPDLALKLLDKGLAVDPTRWQYAEDAGFVYLWHGDAQQAAAWFTRAGAMPGAPNWLAPLAATTLAGANRQAARVMLLDLADNGDEEWIRRMASRRLRQLDAMDQIDVLQAAVDAYVAAHGTIPPRWTMLADHGAIGGVRLDANGKPVDPTGTPYLYDPQQHRVVLSPQSSLFPLPVEPWQPSHSR